MCTAFQHLADVLPAYDFLRQIIHPSPIPEDLLSPQERFHVLRNTRLDMGQLDVLHRHLFPRHLCMHSPREDLESYIAREMRQVECGLHHDWVVELLFGRVDPTSTSASDLGTPNADIEEASGVSSLCDWYLVSFRHSSLQTALTHLQRLCSQRSPPILQCQGI